MSAEEPMVEIAAEPDDVGSVVEPYQSTSSGSDQLAQPIESGSAASSGLVKAPKRIRAEWMRNYRFQKGLVKKPRKLTSQMLNAAANHVCETVSEDIEVAAGVVVDAVGEVENLVTDVGKRIDGRMTDLHEKIDQVIRQQSSPIDVSLPSSALETEVLITKLKAHLIEKKQEDREHKKRDAQQAREEKKRVEQAAKEEKKRVEQAAKEENRAQAAAKREALKELAKDKEYKTLKSRADALQRDVDSYETTGEPHVFVGGSWHEKALEARLKQYSREAFERMESTVTIQEVGGEDEADDHEGVR